MADKDKEVDELDDKPVEKKKKKKVKESDEKKAKKKDKDSSEEKSSRVITTEGLTDKQVEKSRKEHGSNEIPDSEPTTFWEAFKETFEDPMIRILLAIAVIMIVLFFLGYSEIYEPLGTIIAVLIVAFDLTLLSLTIARFCPT